MEIIEQLFESSAASRIMKSVLAGGTGDQAFLIEADLLSTALFFARRLARGLACLSPESRFCGSCRVCLHPSPPHFNSIIPMGVDLRIQQIHRLSEECGYTLPLGERRVYLIAGAERMNEEAANAFLKLLEEPPGAVSFVLAVSRQRSVLDTIRSRCHRIPVSFPGSLFFLRTLQETPAEGGAPRCWLHAALEIWGASPGLLGGIGRPLSDPFVPSAGLQGEADLWKRHQKRVSAEALAFPETGLFEDLAFALDSSVFLLGVVSRLLEPGGETAALNEARRVVSWTDEIKKGVAKGLTSIEATTRKQFGPSYVHPLREDESYEKSYNRKVVYQAMDAVFRALLFVARDRFIRGQGDEFDQRMSQELALDVPALKGSPSLDFARGVADSVEAARNQLQAPVTPRYVLDNLFLRFQELSRSPAPARPTRPVRVEVSRGS